MRPRLPQPRFGRRTLLLVLLLFVAVVSASAQSPSQSVDRADLFRTPGLFGDNGEEPITGTDPGHAAASPNDPDLGEQAILKRQERYRAFTATFVAPFFYTSNVALTRSGVQDDFVFAPAVAIGYAPHLTKTLYGAFSLSQQQFYYNEFGSFDFGSFDARAGLNYALPTLHDLQLHAEYNFNRLTRSGQLDEDFFSNHALLFSGELPFRIGRAQQVAIGAEAEFSIYADDEAPRRHNFDAYVSYAANLTRSLTLNASGRVAVREYVQTDRSDVSEILAVSATYRFTKWLSASATSSFAANQSNHSVFDYKVANVGAALAVSLRF